MHGYLRRLLIRFIDHFKTDLIKNIYHMRIEGNEPTSDPKQNKVD